MICVCMDCKIVYRIKEPFEDESETHGLCPEHLKARMEEVRKSTPKNHWGDIYENNHRKGPERI